MVGFYGFANIQETSLSVSALPVLDKWDMSQDHAPINKSEKRNIKNYIYRLLLEVFPYETATQYPSLKAKKSLDQIVDYINKYDNKNSRFLIEIFVDALFYSENYNVRHNSIVFVSDMIQNPFLQSILKSRLYQALDVQVPSSVPQSQEKSLTIGPLTITYHRSSQGKELNSSSEATLPALYEAESEDDRLQRERQNFALAQEPNQFSLRRKISDTISKVRRRGFTSPFRIIPVEVVRALHVLADMRPPIGQKDFLIQKAVFDILELVVDKKYSTGKNLDLFGIFETAMRALFNLNPHYPKFDVLLAKVVIKEYYGDGRWGGSLRNSSWLVVALETLEKIPQLNVKVYRTFRTIYNRQKGSVPSGDVDRGDQLMRITDNMERIFEPENFDTKPVREDSKEVSDNKVKINRFKDKNLVRVSPSVFEYIERAPGFRMTPSLRVGFLMIPHNSALTDPAKDIEHLKDMLKKAPSSLEFLRFLVYSFTAPDIYLRSMAVNIAKNMSINENELEAFFMDPKNDSKGQFESEHRRLAMRLWILIDPENPRLHNMLKSAVSDPNFEDIDDIKKEARDFLNKRIISSANVLTDHYHKGTHKCQYSFGGRAI